MACERIRRPHLLIAALVAVLVALWIPTIGHAAERDTLASAGALEQGSGYGRAGGSDAVRTLQLRLRWLGNRPGPIDGFDGPLTKGAVERFQQRHGLAADGIVGRETRRSLFTRTNQPTASPAPHDGQPGTLARKSPAPSIGQSAGEQPHARPLPADAASRAGPASGTIGVPPEAIAALAALAGLSLVLALRRQGEVRLNLGVTCAALLGVFGIGAVAGALFATRAAPHGTDRATAQSGLLPRTPRARPARPTTSPRRARCPRDRTCPQAAEPPRRPRAPRPLFSAARPAIPPRRVPHRVACTRGRRVAPHAPPARAGPARAAAVRPARAGTYVVKPGDSLSDIARTRLSAGSDARVVAEVQSCPTQPRRPDPLRRPDLLETGEELRLRSMRFPIPE